MLLVLTQHTQDITYYAPRSVVLVLSQHTQDITYYAPRSVVLVLTQHRRDHVALRPQRRGCLLGTGTGGEEGERVKARPRIPPEKKTGETVDRRQNNGSVKAVSPRHCAATSALRNCCFNAVLGRVTRTVSVALLFRNNPKRKKSNFRSPAPPPYS